MYFFLDPTAPIQDSELSVPNLAFLCDTKEALVFTRKLALLEPGENETLVGSSPTYVVLISDGKIASPASIKKQAERHGVLPSMIKALADLAKKLGNDKLEWENINQAFAKLPASTRTKRVKKDAYGCPCPRIPNHRSLRYHTRGALEE